MLKEEILSLFEAILKHPYHAHVRSSYEDDEPIVTGFGKTSTESKASSILSHRIHAHGHNTALKYFDGHKKDKDDEDDVFAHDLHSETDKYKISEKAHEHLKHLETNRFTKVHYNNDGENEPEGFELHGPNIKDLHFDHKKKTISHASEVK